MKFWQGLFDVYGIRASGRAIRRQMREAEERKLQAEDRELLKRQVAAFEEIAQGLKRAADER